MNPQIIPPLLLTQFLYIAPTLSYFVGLKNKAVFFFYFSFAWKCGPQSVKCNGSSAVLFFVVTSHPRDTKNYQKSELSLDYLVCEVMEVFCLQLVFHKTSNNIHK